MGDGEKAPLRVQFNPKVCLEFHGATITSDAGLLPIRELDEALGLTDTADGYLQERSAGDQGNADRDTRKDQPASAGARIVHSGSDGMGDNVMGSFRTNRPPRGRRLGRGRGFRTFRLVRRWFRHESGGIERIAWPLTGSVCSFIVRSIPEGLMFREFSSIWEIQAKRH